MKLIHNCYSPESDTWDYDELWKLRSEIDQLLDRVGYDDEEIYQAKVRSRIKGISTDLGVHRDFLAENR